MLDKEVSVFIKSILDKESEKLKITTEQFRAGQVTPRELVLTEALSTVAHMLKSYKQGELQC